ncbi:hypothetical protein [Natronococcus occultus]|uniref:hypothetical protein n=1 Tax=Natronococcus occultus TaxID=29288 RepID=UPI000A05C441|nr:hypothetical protein [Natronococcus occultus]
MKSGATDPFADDQQNDQDENADEPDSNTGQSDPAVEVETRQQEGDNTGQSDSTVAPENHQEGDSNTGQFDRSDLPRIVTRDTVKEDRDAVHQLFVYEDTTEKEKEARRELEDRIGDIYKLDAREAIYRAGMENLDDAEAILRNWGADI